MRCCRRRLTHKSPKRRVPMPVRLVVSWILLAAMYTLAGKLGLALAFVNQSATAVWPPTGIALAALLLLGPRVWPGVFLGAFVANLTAHAPPAAALGIAAGNTLEALAGSWLLREVVGLDLALERVRDALGLIVIGAAV